MTHVFVTDAHVDPTIMSRTLGDRLLQRTGGGCALAGTLILIAALAFRGDLPTHVSVSAGLQFSAEHDCGLLMHLGTVIAPLVWVGAVAALAGTAAGGRARGGAASRAHRRRRGEFLRVQIVHRRLCLQDPD